MHTLYELCLRTIHNGEFEVDYDTLPTDIAKEIQNYNKTPTKISFPIRYNAETLFQLCKTLDIDILIDNNIDSVKRWLRGKGDELNWVSLIRKFIDITSSSPQKRPRKHRIQAFKDLLIFLYTNSGFMNDYARLYMKFFYTLQHKFLHVMIRQAPLEFDETDYRMYQELWGDCVEVEYKKFHWKHVHRSIETRVFNHCVLEEFPIGFEAVPTPGYPGDILNSVYWQRVLKRVKKGIQYPDWECRSSIETERHCHKWYFQGKLLFEKGYMCSIGMYTIDHTTGTMKIPKNKFNKVILE